MIYRDISELRKSIIEEMKAEFPGLPLTIEHYRLAEVRLQTALGVSIQEMTQQVNEIVEEKQEAAKPKS